MSSKKTRVSIVVILFLLYSIIWGWINYSKTSFFSKNEEIKILMSISWDKEGYLSLKLLLGINVVVFLTLIRFYLNSDFPEEIVRYRSRFHLYVTRLKNTLIFSVLFAGVVNGVNTLGVFILTKESFIESNYLFLSMLNALSLSAIYFSLGIVHIFLKSKVNDYQSFVIILFGCLFLVFMHMQGKDWTSVIGANVLYLILLKTYTMMDGVILIIREWLVALWICLIVGLFLNKADFIYRGKE